MNYPIYHIINKCRPSNVICPIIRFIDFYHNAKIYSINCTTPPSSAQSVVFLKIHMTAG